MPTPTNVHVTQQIRGSTAQLVLSLTCVPATQLKPSSVPHRNLNQQGRASTAHLDTPSSTLSLTQVPATHLKPSSSTKVPATHSYFEGDLNEDLDRGQVGGFGNDPNDVPGIPENVFYQDAQFKMPTPTNTHATQQIRGSTAQLVLSSTHVPATQLKPSSVPHRNLNQQGRASTAHLDTPSSTLSLTQVPATHLKLSSSSQVPVTHRNLDQQGRPLHTPSHRTTHKNLNNPLFKTPSSASNTQRLQCCPFETTIINPCACDTQ